MLPIEPRPKPEFVLCVAVVAAVLLDLKSSNLNLSNNRIKSIESNSFYGLINIDKLVLNEKQITILVNRSFNGMINLNELFLEDLRGDFISILR